MIWMKKEWDEYRAKDEATPRKKVVKNVEEAEWFCKGGNWKSTKVAIFVQSYNHASACIRRGGQSRVIQVSADTMRWSPMETVRERLGLDLIQGLYHTEEEARAAGWDGPMTKG